MGIKGRLQRWARATTSIATWARDDIVIPRWLLTVKYGFLALLGVVVIFASQPSIELLTDSAAWTTGWGYGVAFFAVGCFAGSLSARKLHERIERICSVGLMSLFVVYALAPIYLVIVQHDLDRASLSVVALALSIVPFARMLTLLRSTGAVTLPDPRHG